MGGGVRGEIQFQANHTIRVVLESFASPTNKPKQKKTRGCRDLPLQKQTKTTWLPSPAVTKTNKNHVAAVTCRYKNKQKPRDCRYLPLQTNKNHVAAVICRYKQTQPTWLPLPAVTNKP
jgi:hypothetical protein